MAKAARIEYHSLEALVSAHRNPKRHDVERIKGSLRRFGFVAPLVVNGETTTLVAGHGRLRALLEMRDAGEAPPTRVALEDDADGAPAWLVPVLCGVEFVSEKEAEAYLLADNRLVELGGWDDGLLVEILKDHDGAPLGWSDADLSVLVTSPSPAIGPSPEDLEERFQQADIKQIVLFFDSEGYERTLGRLQKLMEAEGLDNHTAAFLRLLDRYEASER